MNPKLLQQLVFSLLAIAANAQQNNFGSVNNPSNLWVGQGFGSPSEPNEDSQQLFEIKNILAGLQLVTEQHERKTGEMFEILQSRLQGFERSLARMARRQANLEMQVPEIEILQSRLQGFEQSLASLTDRQGSLEMQVPQIEISQLRIKEIDQLLAKWTERLEILEKILPQQLTESIKLIHMEYQAELAGMKDKQHHLEMKVAQILENTPVVVGVPKISKHVLDENQKDGKMPISLKPRTCYDVRKLNPALQSGFYWIDPDGESIGEDPIYVYCDMASGSTLINHDSNVTDLRLANCSDPGCLSREITYVAPKNQIEALVQQSGKCRQFIRYDCSMAALEMYGVKYSWWEDKNGQPRYFWSGNDTNLPHTCQCGIEKNCIYDDVKCNCDADALPETFDEGYISVRDILPVRRLIFSPPFGVQSSGRFSLGPLECHGDVIVKGIPTSCMDVWRIGHHLSGVYSVRGLNRVHSVFCDFTKPLHDSGFEVPLGYVDIKSASVYFQVQRNSDFSSINTAVTYDTEMTSQGRAINIDSGVFVAPRQGKYFFAFSGVKQTADTRVGIMVNDKTVSTSSSADSRESVTLLATLDLGKEDKVSVNLLSGSLSNSGPHQFSGFFLEEDLLFRAAKARKELGTVQDHQ